MNTIENTTLRDAITLSVRIADLEAQLGGLLNCKPSDAKKAIAVLMEAEGLKVATQTYAGRTYSMTYVAATPDGEQFDTDTAKAILTEKGIPWPMKFKKGSAAYARTK